MTALEHFKAVVDEEREYFDGHLSLPWSPPPLSDPLWKHDAVAQVLDLDASQAEPFLQYMFEDESSALTGIAVRLVGNLMLMDHAEQVRNALNHDSMPVRALAAWAVGELQDAEGIAQLYDTRDEEHGEVKKMVVQVLQRARDPRAIPLLGRWIGRAREDEELRCNACKALGHLGDDAAVPVLARVLSDETALVTLRQQAANSLGRIQSKETRELLLKRVESGDVTAAPWCLEAFIDTKAEEVPEALGGLSTHKDPGVRAAALRAAPLHCTNFAEGLAKHCLSDADESVRGVAFEVLTKMNPASRHWAAMRFLEDPSLELRRRAVQLAEELSGQQFSVAVDGVVSTEQLERAVSLARDALQSAEQA